MAVRLVFLAWLALVVAGCSAPAASHAVAGTTSPTVTALPAAPSTSGGSWGKTPIQKGNIPSWATVNAPSFLPYAVATPDIAMGNLFTYPLQTDPDRNKILWYVRAPRDGSALRPG